MCETNRKTLTSPKQSDVIDLISSEEENSIVVSTPKPPPTQTTQPIHTTKKKRKRELYFAVSSTTGRVFVYVVFERVCSSAKRENFYRVSISRYHENITNLYYKKITGTPTLECTVECNENSDTNDRTQVPNGALVHRSSGR